MRRECRERFPRHRLKGKLLVSDPDMHQSTYVTRVPWCISRSPTRGGGENVAGIPGASANPQTCVSGKRSMDNTVFNYCMIRLLICALHTLVRLSSFFGKCSMFGELQEHPYRLCVLSVFNHVHKAYEDMWSELMHWGHGSVITFHEYRGI